MPAISATEAGPPILHANGIVTSSWLPFELVRRTDQFFRPRKTSAVSGMKMARLHTPADGSTILKTSITSTTFPVTTDHIVTPSLYRHQQHQHTQIIFGPTKPVTRTSTMPIHSTLQPIPCDTSMFNSFEVDEDPAHAHTGNQIVETPLADSFLAGACTSPGQLRYTELGSNHHHGAAPSDGNIVWYCCQCGDGGLPAWQSACPGYCGHKRCGYCQVQEV